VFDAGIRALVDSGYFRLRNADAVLLFDAGPLGPRYLMGHGHADTLSFEMSFAGRRLFVNSGTSTYQAGPQRMVGRGSAAHNTVAVDGRDSSEVWSAFRVARAASIVERRWSISAGRLAIAAAHDGFHRQFHGPVHRREVTLEPDTVRITDHLHGGTWRAAEAHFHFAPGVAVTVEADGHSGRITLGDRVLHWALEGGAAAVGTGEWHPGFNRSVPGEVLTARFAVSPLVFTVHWR
jgi:uncharacterized heparinase superfamily protein